MRVCRGYAFDVEYEAFRSSLHATKLQSVQVVANSPVDAVETARKVLTERQVHLERVHQVLNKGEIWMTVE